MATGKRVDPYGSFNFLVEIDGISRASFQDCSGLGSSIDVKEYNEGGRNTPMKLLGLAKYTNIVLKRGVTDDAELWEWHQQAIGGAVERQNGSIVLIDRAGNEKVRWNFFEGWVTKWTGPDFKAEAGDVAIETIEIAHERCERV
jgi:phage tail-like protein